MIEAGEVALRPWRPEDASAVFHACQDAAIQRWLRLPQPYTARHAVEFVRAHAGPQPEPSGAYFAAVRLETGEVLGSVSFDRLADGAGEIGGWLDPFARGRGLATAAVAGLTAWGFAELGLERVRCRVARGNGAARRTLERAGFTREGVETAGGHDGGRPVDALVYGRRCE